MSYPTEINALPAMRQDSDGNLSETFTVPSAAPYIYDLGSNAPLSYPSGYRIVPPSGIANVVTISGASQTWTEVTTTPASAGSFQVDYTASPTGGRLTFSAADAGKTATVTYYGATLVNEALEQGIITGLKSVVSARGAANGLAALDGSTNLQIPAGHKLSAPGQTGGAANQAVGVVNIPNNTADGTQTTVANTLVTTNSTIILTMASIPGDCTSVAEIVSARVAGTSFKIQNKGATSSTGGHGLDVAYLIIN